jgi:tRNA(fMet)-specific endonuclease VapC
VIRHLLDTNACIELIRRRSRGVLARVKSARPGTLGLSSITLAELFHGVARSSDPARNLAALAMFCAPFDVLPFDDRAAEAHGRVRSGLERAGTPAGPLDTLIAAHALSRGAILVTDNERGFRRVEGLEVENWARGTPPE